MILRTLFEAFSLNVPFFAALIMDNLFITFAVFAAFKIIIGKKTYPHFFFLVGMLYALQDFMHMNQFTFFPKANLIYFFCFVLAPIWVLAEGTRFAHKRKILIVSAIIFLSWGIS